MFSTLENLDIELFFLINQLPHNQLLDTLSQIVDILVGYAVIFFIVGLIVFIKNREKFTEYALLSSITLISSVFISSVVLKNIFERLRPAAVLEDVIIVGQPMGQYSFPSGHSTVIFSFLVISILVLGVKSKDRVLVMIFAVMAVLTSFGRVYVGHHYPSDVLAGAFVGMVIAFTIYTLLMKMIYVMFADEYEKSE